MTTEPRPNPDPNTANPLYLNRLGANPFGKLNHKELDTNFLSLLRLRGEWAPSTYEVNETVYYHGQFWVAMTRTALEPKRGVIDWVPLTGLAGRGGMSLSTPGATFPNLGGTWQAITAFDQIDIAPIGCLFDFTADTLRFDYRGTWQLNFYFTFEHNSSNQGRTTRLRLFNVTDGTPLGAGTIIATGRNAEATSATGSVILDVDDASLADVVQVEIGNGDTYTDVAFDAAAISAVQVGV